MSAKKLYRVNTGIGVCIRAAVDEDEAYEEVLREVGTNAGVSDVCEATESDIAWVKGMGGYVPSIAKAEGKQ